MEAGCAQTMTPFGGHGPHLRPEDYGSPRTEGELPQRGKGIRPGCAAANHDLDSFRLTAENRAEVLDALREFVVHYDYDKIWAEQP